MLQATRQDSGLYEARVQNELGYEISTFSVNVLGNQKIVQVAGSAVRVYVLCVAYIGLSVCLFIV